MRAFSLCLLSGLLAGEALAQPAHVRYFGQACYPTLNSSIGIQVVGLPRLGQPVQIVYTGRNGGGSYGYDMPFLVHGISNTSWAGVPLPFRVPDVRDPQLPNGCFQGCDVRVSVEVIQDFPFDQGTRRYDAVARFVVPSEPSLLGLTSHHQFFCLSRNIFECLELSSSPGAALTVGI